MNETAHALGKFIGFLWHTGMTQCVIMSSTLALGYSVWQDLRWEEGTGIGLCLIWLHWAAVATAGWIRK